MALGPQLLSNPGAETDTAGWSPSNATLARVTTPVRTGTGAFGLTATAAGDVLMFAAELTSGLNPGQPVVLTANVRSAAAARSAVFLVDWSSGTGYVSTSSTPTTATVTTGYTTLTATVTMPANATKGLFYLKVIGCAAAEVHYADDFSVKSDSIPPTVTAFGPARTIWRDPIALSASGLDFTSVAWSVVSQPAGNTDTFDSATASATTVRPGVLHGPRTYRVTATGPGGTATSDVTVDVRRQLLRYTATGSEPLRLQRY